ncbi:MAG: thioredoxin family protein [Urechidicola sp.]|nr:thioredoxin family protein [Urechidicola sp.]
MKTIFQLLFVALFLSPTISNAISGIDFKDKSLEEAKEMAAKENKIIFVDAYADWCGPCKWMSANTFPDLEVGNYFNEQFISLQIDMESEVGIDFDLEYGIDAYPTLLFLNSKGEVIKRYSSALDAQELLGFGKRVIDPTSALSYKLKKKIDAGDMDENLLSEYLIACIEDFEEPDDVIIGTYLSILEDKSKTDIDFIAEYLIESNSYERDVNNDLVNLYFDKLDTSTLIEDEPFTIFYYFQQDLKAPSTLYFIKNYTDFAAVWGEYIEDKLGILLVNATEEIKSGVIKKEDLYAFIKTYSEHNDVDYTELKLLIDEILDAEY